MSWTLEKDLPDMTGKTVIITGASAGIGLEAARIFVTRANAHVIMACRNTTKAQPLADELNAAATTGKATVFEVDTSNLASVRTFADAVDSAGITAIDVLVLNAGIMFGPFRTAKTESAENPQIELQMATNHLGHFLMTHLLLPKIMGTPNARVVSVSSVMAHFASEINYDVVLGKTPQAYDPKKCYSYTKLANQLFTMELGRRLTAAGSDTCALSAHPGYSVTNLQNYENKSSLMNLMEKIVLIPLLAHDAISGSLPTVMAAVDLEKVEQGSLYGPSYRMEFRGPPRRNCKVPASARSAELANKLWTVSEELCGISSNI